MSLRYAASCFAAFAFAALFAAIPLAIIFSIDANLHRFAGLLSLIFGIVLVHAIVLGLPLFLVLRHYGWINAFSSVGAGFLVGATGIIFLTLGQFDSGFSSSIGDVPQVINGVPTATGWVRNFKLLGQFGVLGAFSGLVFWYILKWSGGAVRTGYPSDVSDYKKRKAGTGIAIAALVATVAVFTAPAATKDRTCHNIFRDARTIGPPLASIDLSIAIDNWPTLIQLFRELAKVNQWSFRNAGRDEFDARRVLDLSLCDESGLNITAKTELWAAGIGISVRRLRDSAGSAELAGDLADKLELRWPGSVTFRDVRGNAIPKPR
jgi:hypothetical protein